MRFAESEGFEPPVQLPVHRISSATRSTTPAAFQKIWRKVNTFSSYFDNLPRKLFSQRFQGFGRQIQQWVDRNFIPYGMFHPNLGDDAALRKHSG